MGYLFPWLGFYIVALGVLYYACSSLQDSVEGYSSHKYKHACSAILRRMHVHQWHSYIKLSGGKATTNPMYDRPLAR